MDGVCLKVISSKEHQGNYAGARAWAEVNPEAIRNNISRIAKTVAPAMVMAVVKADGYGHGSLLVAKEAIAAGAKRLAVATIHEAVLLRDAGIKVPIQVLGVILEGDKENFSRMANMLATVSSMEEAQSLNAAGRDAGCTIGIHIKLDSGMHRLGADPHAARDLARFLHTSENIDFEGAMTHLATAGSDEAYVHKQIAVFNDFLAWMRQEGICPAIIHAANSSAVFVHPETRYNMVRPGLAVYGVGNTVEETNSYIKAGLLPAMKLCSRILNLRQLQSGEPVGYNCTWRANRNSLIATASIGYADGLRTALGNKGAALVNGQRVPIIGRVSMDFTALDVTDLSGVNVGDEVVFFGKQKNSEISISECAANMGAIPYELMCGVSNRVWRVTV
jgi:alanine racemase